MGAGSRRAGRPARFIHLVLNRAYGWTTAGGIAWLLTINQADKAKVANPPVRKANIRLPKFRKARHRRNRAPVPRSDRKVPARAMKARRASGALRIPTTAATTAAAVRWKPGRTINAARSDVRDGNSLPAARCKPAVARSHLPTSADMAA